MLHIIKWCAFVVDQLFFLCSLLHSHQHTRLGDKDRQFDNLTILAQWTGLAWEFVHFTLTYKAG